MVHVHMVSNKVLTIVYAPGQYDVCSFSMLPPDNLNQIISEVTRFIGFHYILKSVYFVYVFD